MRIGIMGGTFDPIHLGHLATAESVREIFNLNEVIFIPSARPPHKTDKQVTAAAHRLAMTILATRSNPKFSVSATEILREGLSYTIDTIDELHKKFGETAELFFMVGADMLADLSHWYHAKELVEKCKFVATTRQGSTADIEEVEKFFGAERMKNINLITTPGLEISSTDIREKVKAGKSIKYLVPEKVEEYIKDEGLYL